MSDWISIKEKFPPTGKPILVSDGGKVRLMKLMLVWQSLDEQSFWGVTEEKIKEPDLYWQHAPEPVVLPKNAGDENETDRCETVS